jgi:membrane fusion protein, heavy metal efflux system
MVGQPATVLVETNEQVKGIVLPREAVVRAPNGDMLVWQHAASERLVPKPVRAELVNGEHFVVLAGLETGQSVVVKGAELINQVR